MSSNAKKKPSVHTRNPAELADHPPPSRIEYTEESHSGPLPTPADFGGYEAVVQGAAREILDMAKAEAAHRHKIETEKLAQNKEFIRLEEKKIGNIQTGQFIGAGSVIGALALSAYALHCGQGLAAVAFVVAEMAFLVSAFIWGGKKKDAKPEKKDVKPT